MYEILSYSNPVRDAFTRTSPHPPPLDPSLIVVAPPTRLKYDQIVPSCFPRVDGFVTCFANFDRSNVLGLHLGAFSMSLLS